MSILLTPAPKVRSHYQKGMLEVHKLSYKNEVLDGPGLAIFVPLYGTSLFTIGIFNLMAFFLFRTKGICIICLGLQ